MILSGLKTWLETGELLETPGSQRYAEPSRYSRIRGLRPASLAGAPLHPGDASAAHLGGRTQLAGLLDSVEVTRGADDTTPFQSCTNCAASPARPALPEDGRRGSRSVETNVISVLGAACPVAPRRARRRARP